MSLDPNELDVDDYYELEIKERKLLDDWLKSLGGHPTRTRKLILRTQDQCVLAEEYIVDERGNPINTFNYKTKDIEVNTFEFYYGDNLAPIWKAISKGGGN